ncbi:MAG: YhbY family RNA-binding protein [Phycisphaerae bacterium]
MELSGKEKRRLRGLGRSLSPVATVGKAGLSEEFIAQVEELLEQLELLKLRLPAGPSSIRKAQADEVAERTQATLVDLVGRMVVLYRPKPQA